MMKITIGQAQLLAGVNSVIRTVPGKPSTPVLSGIHLKAEGGKLTFTATDLAMTSKCTLGADVEGVGEAVVPAKLFVDFVRKLPDTNIGIEVGDDGMMALSYFFSSVSLKCLPTVEFPIVGKVATETIAISVGLLKKAIRQTTGATAEGSMAESRPVFGGVLFELTADGELNLVATDTHQMAVKRSMGLASTTAKSVIVPSKAVDEVFKLLKDDEDTVQLGLGEDFVTFTFGNHSVYARLIGGTFPPYKNVLPKTVLTSLQVSTKSFAEALGRAAVMTKGDSKVVCFTIAEGSDKLVLTSQSDGGKILEQVTVTNVSGVAVTVAFNASFMVDALKVLDSEEATLELNGPQGPGVLKALGDDSYLYLALPVRINAPAAKAA